MENGNSGRGSYGEFAVYKANIINGFIKEHHIKNIAEFGCGDGNQMQMFEVAQYTGYDVSYKALELCEKLKKENFKFIHTSKYDNEQYEMTLSLDVIYHLIENDVYEKYMNTLFQASSQFVCIYASNKEMREAMHVKHRCFTNYISKNFPEWELIRFIDNPYKVTKGTPSDFYFFQKIEKC